jgi:serine/threonine-protein kinase
MPEQPDSDRPTPVEGRGPLDCGRAEASVPSTALRASVLGRLEETTGPVPRVFLRDTETDPQPEPLVRTASPEMPAPADRSSSLQILGEIGRGGMGAVLKGRDTDLGRDLAVKVLLEKHRDDPDLARRFVEEAQIAGQLQHPGVVPVYELGCFGDARPYFTMKLVKGRTLAQLLGDRPASGADRPRLLGIFEAVCQTVAYAHARGVIHRDLKPSNIMVGSFGEVQVMDWGLAKVLPRGGSADDAAAGRMATPAQETVIATARSGSASDLSCAGSVLGTPSYMAPEQARGEIGSVDERSDVFALGSILCEILTGGPACTGRSPGEIQRKAARGELDDAGSRLSRCAADGELVGLARECLAPEPDDRPRDAGVVAGRLTAYLAGVQERLRAAELAQAAEAARAAEAVRTAEAAEARSRAERRARRLTAALAASLVALLGLGGGGVAWLQRRHAQQAAATALAVNDALDAAARRRGEALATGDLAPWGEALGAAQRAAALVGQGEADAALRRRVVATLGQVTGDYEEAKARAQRAAADRRLLAGLETIRGDRVEHLDPKRTDAAYAAAFRAAGLDLDRTDPKAAGSWIAGRSAPVELAAYLDDWAYVRRLAGVKADAEPCRRLIEAARAADPDPWRDALRAKVAPQDAEAFQRLAADDAALGSQPAASLVLLALQLKHVAKDSARAERVLRRAWRRDPGDFWVNFELAQVRLENPGASRAILPRPEEAIPYLTAAVAIRPRSMRAHGRLGVALYAQGKLAEAEAEFGEASRLDPGDAAAHVTLGVVLRDQGKLAEAEAEFREAIRLQPDYAAIHSVLGLILRDRGELEAAVASFREAARLDATFNGAVIWDLGATLRDLGRYDEALAAYRKARELARDDRSQIERAETELALTGRIKALGDRLPAFLARPEGLKDASEALAFARLCTGRRLFAAGAGFYAHAFAGDPKIADDRRAHDRYHAACVAALAGCGKGKDDPTPDAAARAGLRRQALVWLKAELAAWARQVDDGKPEARAAVAGTLRRWRSDRDLLGVRDPDALAKLPVAERDDWRALWAEVDRLREGAGKAP